MWEDPIVAEVHKVREQLVAGCNYDIDAFFAGLLMRQAASVDRLARARNQAEASQPNSPVNATQASNSLSVN